MLRTLLESKGRSPRRRLALTASVVAHSVLLGVLVMARVEKTEAATEPPLTGIVYFPPQRPAPRPERTDPTHTRVVPRDNFSLPPVLALPDRIVSGIPDRVGSIVPVHAPAFRGMAARDLVLPDEARERSEVLTERTVDQPVELLPNQRPPRYPSMLERAGVGGDVVAQFVVDTTGRVERRSIDIQHTTHPELARAVQERLMALRFAPARARGRVVRQLVEQQFRFEVVRR